MTIAQEPGARSRQLDFGISASENSFAFDNQRSSFEKEKKQKDLLRLPGRLGRGYAAFAYWGDHTNKE